MNFLKFDPKRDGRTSEPPITVPNGVFEGDIWMGQCILRLEEDGEIVYSQGNFGHFLTDRSITANCSLFACPQGLSNSVENGEGPEKKRKKEEEELETTNEVMDRWNDLHPVDRRLRLSPEETVFLSRKGLLILYYKGVPFSLKQLWTYFCDQYGGRSFLQRHSVYSSLREYGWVPRSGQSFGCEYYYFHATAGVKIVDKDIDTYEMVALNRSLFNVKKSLFLANVTVSDEWNPNEVETIDMVKVEIVAQSTFFPDRNREQ